MHAFRARFLRDLPGGAAPVKKSCVGRAALQKRVVQAAEDAFARDRYVTAIDVLTGLGWLPQARLDEWRQGRLPYLEAGVQAGLGKVSEAMLTFRKWAVNRGLKPSETVYVARTRSRQRLRFSKSGNPAIERAYRTHWVSPQLSEEKWERKAARSLSPDLVVIMPLREWACAKCGGTGGFLIMDEPGPLCMACAEMDHLVYLPAGDAALTRRAKKESQMSAVVVRFSRARKRYERQGILVEEDALDRAARELDTRITQEARSLPNPNE
jgi:hypothetical protein